MEHNRSITFQNFLVYWPFLKVLVHFRHFCSFLPILNAFWKFSVYSRLLTFLNIFKVIFRRFWNILEILGAIQKLWILGAKLYFLISSSEIESYENIIELSGLGESKNFTVGPLIYNYSKCSKWLWIFYFIITYL